MGATDYVVHLKTTDRTKLQQLWDKASATDRHQNGHDGYTGGPSSMGGTVDFTYFDNEPFGDKHAADEFILDKHQKWDGPIAVRYKENGNIYTAIGGLAAE